MFLSITISVKFVNNCDIIIRVFWPRAGPSLQTQTPRLQFYPNSRTKLALLLGMNRCGSFPLFSAPHILFRMWGECIWQTRPSGLRRNSPHGLNISSIKVLHQFRYPEIQSPLASIIMTDTGNYEKKIAQQ